MIKNYIIGKINPKLKGEAYKKAISSALSPESIAKTDPEEETETTAMETKEHKEDREPAGK